ncbi:MAG: endonuclease NucS [Bacteroidota bacterium]|nr:endonuclease NucS [Bacteroidota bacterium]
MATEIKTWQLINGKLTPVSSSLVDNGRKEKDDLEQWIKSNPEILGNDIAIIGEQVLTKSGPLDFLGIDRSGNLVIVELKRDKLPREVLAQAIDYASDIATYEPDDLNEICQTFTGQRLSDYLTEKFPDTNFEEISVNQTQRLLLVGFAIEEPLHRMIEWLSEKFNLAINAIVLHYVRTKSGDELLSRTVIISEDIEREKVNKKKFVIEMSNEPGNYDETSLKEHLKRYLSQNLYSSKRIRDYFLPVLLKNGKVTREQMRKEFVKMKAAPDESQAGYFLALISVQLGHKWKDYLRQVISFEYPNNRWEKDNFSIRPEYRQLVEEVLNELGTGQKARNSSIELPDTERSTSFHSV